MRTKRRKPFIVNHITALLLEILVSSPNTNIDNSHIIWTIASIAEHPISLQIRTRCQVIHSKWRSIILRLKNQSAKLVTTTVVSSIAPSWESYITLYSQSLILPSLTNPRPLDDTDLPGNERPQKWEYLLAAILINKVMTENFENQVLFESPTEKFACETDLACNKLIKEASSSIFMIKGDRSSGTGWMTPDGRILTDEHVVNKNARLVAVDQHGKRYRLGKDSTIDPSTDLAVLGFASDPPPNVKPLPVADSSPKPGETVYSLNHSKLLPLQLQRGIYESTKTGIALNLEQDTKGVWQQQMALLKRNNPGSYQHLQQQLNRNYDAIKLNATHGGSGGPVFNSKLQVSSVIDKGSFDKKLNMTTPSAEIHSILAKPKTHTGEYTSSFNYFMQNSSSTEKISTSTTLGLAGVTGIALQSGVRSRIAPVAAAGMILNQGFTDMNRFSTSGDYRDRLKYGYSMGADVVMAAGLATKLVPKTNILGLGILGTGALMRLSAELFPNEFVLKENPE